MDGISPVWLLVTSLLSGLVATAVTILVRAWLDRREIKRDVLRRIAGHRWSLAGKPEPQASPEFLTAVNEVFIVFAEDSEVLVVCLLNKLTLDVRGVSTVRAGIAVRRPVRPHASNRKVISGTHH